MTQYLRAALIQILAVSSSYLGVMYRGDNLFVLLCQVTENAPALFCHYDED